MTTVSIPPPLQKYTGGSAKLQLAAEGGTLDSVLDRLHARFPELRAAVVSDRGEIRRFVTVFVDRKNVKHLDGLATKVSPDSAITILVALAGG